VQRSAVLILVLCAVLAGCSWGGGSTHATMAIRSKVVPRQPLSFAACMREARGWGYSFGAARQFGCSPSAFQAPWFHGTFTNESAPGTYIHCTFTAWDANGQRLFNGWLPLVEVGFRAGMFLYRHQTRSINWYFDALSYRDAARYAHAVTRYTTSCKPWRNWPI